MHMGMNSCTLCPRRCAVRGAVCGAPDDLEVAAICTHTGEEPPLNPIVNVFFAHCSLHCIFCQNNDISAAEVNPEFIHYRTTDQVADQICLQLEKQESSLLGFVTPTHYANRIPDILDAIHRHGATPTVVYNSSGYESVDTLRSLEGLVDIYLPDFKYMDSALASLCSHAPDYPEVAQAAIREMIRQVGTGLKLDENGAAYYRGKHDQAFAMRRDLEERLQHDAATVSNMVDIWTEEIMRWRKWTFWPRRRENLLALCDTLKSLK